MSWTDKAELSDGFPCFVHSETILIIFMTPRYMDNAFAALPPPPPPPGVPYPLSLRHSFPSSFRAAAAGEGSRGGHLLTDNTGH